MLDNQYIKTSVEYRHSPEEDENVSFWYATKYYADHILPQLLKNEEYVEVNNYVISNKFMFAVRAGLLTKVDFSNFVINWWIPLRGRPDPSQLNPQSYSKDMIFFDNSKYITLSKEASLKLILWHFEYTQKNNFKEMGIYQRYSLPRTVFFKTYDKQYNDCIKEWLNTKSPARKHLGTIIDAWVNELPVNNLNLNDIKGLFNYMAEERAINYERTPDAAKTWVFDSFKYCNAEELTLLRLKTAAIVNFSMYSSSEAKQIAQEICNNDLDYYSPNSFKTLTHTLTVSDLLQDVPQFLNIFKEKNQHDFLTRTKTHFYIPLHSQLQVNASQIGELKNSVYHHSYPAVVNSYLKLKNIHPIMSEEYVENLKQEARNALEIKPEETVPTKWLLSIMESMV